MRLVTLVENVVYGKFTAEHGLSIYIEYGGHRILFDTGQSDRFLRNAEALEIDIASVDALILSHGHYDHSGGLEHFCRANTKARIYAKRGLFQQKYNKDGRFIGIPYDASLYAGRLIELDASTEIMPGVHVVTDIPLTHPWDTHFENLHVRVGDALTTDTFEDEQFLAIETESGLAVISGCSHRGITNILESARRIFFSAETLARNRESDADSGAHSSEARFRLVLGGFHLSNASDELADHVVHKLADMQITQLGCCHCTGVDNYARIKARFGTSAFYAWTGTDLRI